MVNVGILTFHNNENKGAMLQCYCLKQVLDNIFQANTETIEYRTKSKERKRISKLFVTKQPWTVPRRIKDRKISHEFVNNKLNPSESKITTDDHNRAVEWLESKEYDIVVTGSDEVWKALPQKSHLLGNIFPRRPFPSLYFLDPDLSCLKVAYAASANTTQLERLDDEDVKKFQNHISSYDNISVRDRYTESILEQLGVNDVYRVPDPTIMVDIPSKDVNSILRKYGIGPTTKTLGFHGSDNEVFKELTEYYRDRGYTIISMTGSKYADIELQGRISPLEYYSMYDHFNMVITSSLHSTIFSLKHNTPFVTIDTSDIYTNIESKTYSLLDDFDLLDRHIDASNKDAEEFYNSIDKLEQEPDEDCVSEKINNLQKKGNEFFNKVKESYEKNK